ncbi:MAG: hypothetical protein Q7T30_03170 [Planctomycetota bacterium]|nr:hypothetical protein [Planctomycetota bacterium]
MIHRLPFGALCAFGIAATVSAQRITLPPLPAPIPMIVPSPPPSPPPPPPPPPPRINPTPVPLPAIDDERTRRLRSN